MTIQEAYTILALDSQADDKEVKFKFRQLMTKYHPDSVGSDAPEHLKMAQRINEAYAILRNRRAVNKDEVIKRAVWEGKVKKDAFTERMIYMQAILWEEHRTEYYEVAKGRYEWDPDLEEFDCLLRSLNQAVIELLENIERQNEIYDEDYMKEIRFKYQVNLFHLLAGQFIPSLSCLSKLAKPEMTDEEGKEIYKFQAFLGSEGNGKTFEALSRLKEKEVIYISSILHNRMFVVNSAGAELGHLSFADDQLYYVIIPILKKRMAQVKFIVRETEIQKKSYCKRAKVNVDLFLRMDCMKEESSCEEQNKKIQAVLNQYGAYLRK